LRWGRRWWPMSNIESNYPASFLQAANRPALREA
jgi:hypothetical protein